MIKHISIALCILQVAACASTQPNYSKTKSIEDKIIAIGKISDSKQNKIVFTGEEYSYVAEQGGDTVFKIIEKTEANKRSLINRLPIEFNMVSKTEFTTSLAIRYEVPIGQLEPELYANLQALGFNRTAYNCRTQVRNDDCNYPLASINLRGKVYQKDPNTIPFKLKQPYPIYISEKYSNDKKQFGKKAGNALKTIAVAPLVAAGIVLYTPVVLTIGLFSIGDPDVWH